MIHAEFCPKRLIAQPDTSHAPLCSQLQTAVSLMIAVLAVSWQYGVSDSLRYHLIKLIASHAVL